MGVASAFAACSLSRSLVRRYRPCGLSARWAHPGVSAISPILPREALSNGVRRLGGRLILRRLLRGYLRRTAEAEMLVKLPLAVSRISLVRSGIRKKRSSWKVPCLICHRKCLWYDICCQCFEILRSWKGEPFDTKQNVSEHYILVEKTDVRHFRNRMQIIQRFKFMREKTLLGLGLICNHSNASYSRVLRLNFL